MSPSKGRFGLLAFTAVAALVGLSAAAMAAPDATRVIRVTATEISGNTQAKPPPGPAGDLIVGSDRLRNAVPQFGKPKGAVVGKDTYRLVFRGAHVAAISVTATLPGGTIRCGGTFDDRRRFQLIRVVGGTGSFAAVTGTCEARPSGSATLNIYRLR